MTPEKLSHFPTRYPELFSAEINRQVLANGELRRLLYAAIHALPYVQDDRCREELKRALCELIAPDLDA
jgi:hypothetical protein